MSEHAANLPHGGGHPPAAAHPHINYVKIWAILCGLLALSVAGPMLEIQVVTLITAFGIAVVKAYLVLKNFMHINLEKRFVIYMVAGMVTLMLLMFGGVAPDVLKHEGANWSNDSAKQWVKQELAKDAANPKAHH